MAAWALQLRSMELEALGILWNVPGIEALQQEAEVWVRGNYADDVTARLLESVPCEGRYAVLPDRQLQRAGHRVPRGHLPEGTWQPLKKFLTLILPPASLPARQNVRVTVRLVPSSIVHEPNVLLTDLALWMEYVATAPQVRLRCCQFAAADDGRVVVQGTPLPPIAGQRAIARSGLVVPCGWMWTPAVDASIVARAWQIPDGELWLMWPGRPLERIPAEHFVAAERSAVRQTMEAWPHVRSQ